MPNTDRLINHQDGLKIVSQLEEIASALGHSSKVTGVKGNAEVNYRTGNVNITPSDLGLGHVQEDIDELANEKADAATTLAGYGITDSYTKSEVDNIVSEIETNILWKQAVTNYADIATTYPNPEDGWTVTVTSTNQTYRYNGSEWVMINTNIIPEATTSVSGLMTSAQVVKLNGIEEGAEANVQADWSQTSSSHDGFIKNKPTIPSKTSDLLNDSNYITNENLSVVAMTGEFSDLDDVPTTISGYGISDAYTKDEVDNIVSTIESNVAWKEAVTNYVDIATTYPNPEEGWTVNVTSINTTYRYNGTEWVIINTNIIPSATTSVNGLMTTTHVEKLNSVEEDAQKNVQTDWNEDDSTSDAYLKNKPTLGTASAKDVPTSGDATSAQVVLGSDSRLSDARPASDVSAWAKAATKPAYTASEVGAIASTEKGAASGVAELDASGKVPSSQLPSYVDDVKEGYLNSADGKFYEESTYETEITPEADKIYVDKSTNKTYRWSGSAYVSIGSDLALGETSSTAYRGDRGKIAYDTALENKDTIKDISNALPSVPGDSWEENVFIGPFYFNASYVWTDGTNIYYSNSKTQCVLDKSTSTWSTKAWTGLTSFNGSNVWIDGTDIYYSSGSNQYVFDKSTSTWSTKTWTGLTSFSGSYVWTDGDNIYYSTGSANYQYVLDKSTCTWSTKTWTGITSFYGNNIWTDGIDTYCSSGSNQYVLDKSTSTWSTKAWTGLTSFNGSNVWTDGDNIYYSSGEAQYILDKSTSTWSTKTWTGLTSFDGSYIWTDGTNIYFSSGEVQYILDKSTSTWSAKTWNSNVPYYFDGSYIWADGENIYYSNSTTQCVLDKSTSTWSTKTWTGITSLYGSSIWTDGDNIYYSFNSLQYVLDKSTSTWSTKTWTGITSFNGFDVWTDGDNIYYSLNSSQYVFDKSTSTWSEKTWTGLTSFNGSNVWTDGTNIYFSNSTTQYVLDKSTSTWSVKTWTGLTSFDGSSIWTDGTNIYYSKMTTQYVLDKSTSTWSAKTWTGITNPSGLYVWTDGNNIYFSTVERQYVLSKIITSLGTSATKDFTTSVSSGSSDLVTSGAVYSYVDSMITQALSAGY